MHIMSTKVPNNENVSLQPLLTGSDLQRMLRVHLRTIRRMWEKNEFPRPMKIGNSNRWRVEDVKAALDRFASSQKENELAS
jgi:predicted DNA-binding transcriptional regulator AlpA